MKDEFQKIKEELERKLQERNIELARVNEELRLKIMEHEVAEEALGVSQERLYSILNATDDGIVSFDSNGKIVFWNSGAEAIFQYSSSEVSSKNFNIIIPEKLQNGDIFSQITSYARITNRKIEIMGLRKDKSEFPMELSYGNWHSKGETYFTVIIRDMSERKILEENLLREKMRLEEAQKELIRKNIELEETNRIIEENRKKLEVAHEKLKISQIKIIHQEKMASIGQLAAGVAHEINNPAGFISGNLRALDKYVNKFTDFIKAQSGIINGNNSREAIEELNIKKRKLKIDYITEDIKELIKESLDGADRISMIVQDLRGFSRMDEGNCKLSDINECLKSTLNIVRNELKYKATVNNDYGDIPQINCYPQQLKQVFTNLLVNASHAIETKGEIGIKTWFKDNSVFISISDTGCGIRKENISKIFEPFFTTKEEGKGTGLGLSISREIIQKHGGEITVESTPGEGTTFTIMLPCK